MGIILLPFLLIALIIGIIAITKIIKLFKLKALAVKDFMWGFVASITIFSLICLVYVFEGKASELSPIFRIPIFMFVLPFTIHKIIKNNSNKKLQYFSKILLISIVCTIVFAIVFNDIFFDLINYLGLEKQY